MLAEKITIALNPAEVGAVDAYALELANRAAACPDYLEAAELRKLSASRSGTVRQLVRDLLAQRMAAAEKGAKAATKAEAKLRRGVRRGRRA